MTFFCRSRKFFGRVRKYFGRWGGGGGYENVLDVDLQTNILNLNISVSRGVRTSNFANIMWENITKSYGKGAKNRKTFL